MSMELTFAVSQFLNQKSEYAEYCVLLNNYPSDVSLPHNPR